jgi:lipopolysaccharide export system permease protein
MAKQGVWPVWEGMWLSTIVLAALGAFFTYKAVNDSVMMNPDSWKAIFQNYPLVKKIIKHFITKNE